MTLTLAVHTRRFGALMAARDAYQTFLAWIRETPPLENATQLVMLDETGITFRVTYFVTGDDGRFILDDPMPCPGIHPIDYECQRCAAKHVREAVTVISAPRPLPECVLPYFTTKAED
jgi:hypothetical protein